MKRKNTKHHINGKKLADDDKLTTEQQLKTPENLKLLSRSDSQIIVEWDIDKSIRLTDPTRWQYHIFYTTIFNDNNKRTDHDDHVIMNVNGVHASHQAKEKETVIAHGQNWARLGSVLPNDTYSITAMVSDPQNEYATSEKCQPLRVEPFGM